jgi:acyl carrier protein
VAAYLPEITSIIRSLLHDDNVEVTEETCFDALVAWDSMDLVSVVVAVECRFSVEFTTAEIDRLTTVGDLLRMLTAKQALAEA